MTPTTDLKPRFVLRRLLHANLPIFVAIVSYIGLIVSDPATSPFYAIESALSYVGHNYIVTTILIVLLVAVSVSIGYAAIGFRFNKGEGGTGLVFEWLGAKPAMLAAASLLIDFILTDAITMAAATAAIVSLGYQFNRLLLFSGIFFLVAILLRIGDKGRVVFAILSFGFIVLVLVTTILPTLPDAANKINQLYQNSQPHSIPTHANLSGIPLIVLLALGAVRGFALLTGFEASVAALSHEEERPKYARIAMGVGTIFVVLLFTSIVSLNIAQATTVFQLLPNHHNTLFSLWVQTKLDPGLFTQLLSVFSVGILLAGSASGATAGGGLIHVLVKAKILPTTFTHIDKQHNDYKAILIIHVLAGFTTIAFSVNEQRIVSFYAVSVLIGFSLSLLASLIYAYRTKTYYLLAALPGFLMVCLALLLNLTRPQAIVIIVLALALSFKLHANWIKGGQNKIDFSH